MSPNLERYQLDLKVIQTALQLFRSQAVLKLASKAYWRRFQWHRRVSARWATEEQRRARIRTSGHFLRLMRLLEYREKMWPSKPPRVKKNPGKRVFPHKPFPASIPQSNP